MRSWLTVLPLLSLLAGVPPEPDRRVLPEPTPEARRAGVQGTVLLSVLVNEQGLPSGIEVVSPLGFGLDEAAVAALQQWRFHPGQERGHAVAQRVHVPVAFRLPGLWFDRGEERRRTHFNGALDGLRRGGASAAAALATLQRLAAEGYPPAQHLYGVRLRDGDGVDRDEQRGWELLAGAAARRFGPALYEVAERDRRAGRTGEAERELREAAVLGSAHAQFLLADRSERGIGGPADADRARRLFRLCAARGVPQCQVRLARLLLADGAAEHEQVQALAWLQLAADRQLGQAQLLLREHATRVPASVQERAVELKAKLATVVR